jgi:hypothetical protein
MARRVKWARLSVLLAMLLASVLALLDAHGALSSGAGNARARVAAGCGGRPAPEATLVPDAALAEMRATALAVLPRAAGHPYEQGLVGTSNLWSDEQPRLFSAGGAGRRPGAFEVRWWALDAEGRMDDVVVDVLRFADPGKAALALALAADPRCHRAGSARAATLLAGARTLSWLNPDGAYEQDTLLARGRFLYRVADAPPDVGSYPVTEVLACSLPQAACVEGDLAAAGARAGAPAALRPDTSPGWPLTKAQATAYVRAVSLRPYDLSYMTEVQPAATRRAGSEQSYRAMCLPGAPSSAGAGRASPLFAFRRGLQQQTVQSAAVLMASDAAAARYVAAVRRIFAGPCARSFFRQALAAAARSRSRVRLGGLLVGPEQVRAPDTYTGTWPYRAAAGRVSFQVSFTTRRGRRLRLRYYAEGFLFAYRRALVQLSITSTGAPLPQANRRYLESVLVGRAEARWGSP